MSKEIDFELGKDKPSPYDPTLTFLDWTGLALDALALICGWMAGRWWGLGLAAAVVASHFVETYRVHIYRMELVELVTKGIAKYTSFGEEFVNKAVQAGMMSEAEAKEWRR